MEERARQEHVPLLPLAPGRLPEAPCFPSMPPSATRWAGSPQTRSARAPVLPWAPAATWKCLCHPVASGGGGVSDFVEGVQGRYKALSDPGPPPRFLPACPSPTFSLPPRALQGWKIRPTSPLSLFLSLGGTKAGGSWGGTVKSRCVGPAPRAFNPRARLAKLTHSAARSETQPAPRGPGIPRRHDPVAPCPGRVPGSCSPGAHPYPPPW